MSDSTNERKLEHLDIIRGDADVDRRKYYFDDVHLTHRALPELALDAVDPSTILMGRRLSFPLLISSMTGGDHDVVCTINRNLAQAAGRTGVAMAVGSQRVMFTNPAARASFELRDFAPDTLLCANLGAVQFNYGFGIDECREALAVLGADALYLHLNPLQEAVQPEGDTDFRDLADRIGSIAAELDRPIILKEVGAGISPADVRAIVGRGVRYIDVAGAGGTSWSRIENHRNKDDSMGLTFQDWGIPTPKALRQLSEFRDQITLIASGGIRNGVDMAKAVVLGASLCGLASPFLEAATRSADDVVAIIERLRREFTTAMFLLGAASIDKLCANNDLLMPE
jgi:isopentenyl-diphosphate delta-isomerase